MKEIEFNLLDEKWIRVLTPACAVEEVSLTDALVHAHEYTDLAGELPTQDAAVLRLLLAVLQTVFTRMDETGRSAPLTGADEALMRWHRLWQPGRLPEAPIREYLSKWHDRFWLFHPERPFWQVPEAEIGTEYTAAKLNGELSESGNKIRLFPVCASDGKRTMSYAQAARWLLFVNGYDDTSAKPKGKGLPSAGAGWLGKLGMIFASGNNLFGTLLLNLVLLKDGVEPWAPPLPCWELEHARSAERTQIPQPNDQASLLTLQSRRLLLHRDSDKVTGYSLLGGDFFERENAFCEQMTVWRPVQASPHAPISYFPRRHDPARQFWREFPSVFVQQAGVHQPGIVRWIATLQNPRLGFLSRKTLVRFRTTAVKYGDKDFFVTDTFNDEISFHGQLLNELGKQWQALVRDEIAHCEDLANAVGSLAADLAIAAGRRDEDARKNNTAPAREQFYFAIDEPFRRWLASVDPEWDEDETWQSIESWRSQAQRIARTLGTEMVRRSGMAAFVGRSIVKKSGKGKNETERAVHYSAPEAFNSFLRRIAKIYAKGG